MISNMRLIEWIVVILNEIANHILSREAVALAAILGTGVTLYKFLYKRPELILDIEPDEVVGSQNSDPDEDSTIGVLTLLLANVGNRYAEDIQVTLTFDAFNFENDIESSDSPSEDYTPPQAVMDIKSGRMFGFLGGGERHDLYLDNIVYEDDVQELFLGEAMIPDGNHKIKYSISCRTSSHRKGEIELSVNNGDIEIVNRTYPTKLRSAKSVLGWSIDRRRPQELDHLDEDNVQIEFEIGVK